VSDLHDQPDDATPLSAEEREGLIPSQVTIRRELNEVEAQNILEGSLWAMERKRPLISTEFARSLHQRMYGKVWSWAGEYRKTNKNIGVDANQIGRRMHETIEQFRYWLENKTYEPDELAVRFHHALVAIHPFPNGNGRWSRLMGDLMAIQLGQRRFSWGGRVDIGEHGRTRESYIAALKAADNHDMAPLIAFARS